MKLNFIHYLLYKKIVKTLNEQISSVKFMKLSYEIAFYITQLYYKFMKLNTLHD